MFEEPSVSIEVESEYSVYSNSGFDFNTAILRSISFIQRGMIGIFESKRTHFRIINFEIQNARQTV